MSKQVYTKEQLEKIAHKEIGKIAKEVGVAKRYEGKSLLPKATLIEAILNVQNMLAGISMKKEVYDKAKGTTKQKQALKAVTKQEPKFAKAESAQLEHANKGQQKELAKILAKIEENLNGNKTPVKKQPKQRSKPVPKSEAYLPRVPKERFDRLDVGQLVCFQLVLGNGDIKKYETAKVVNISFKNQRIKVATKMGTNYIINFCDVLWIKQQGEGQKWPLQIIKLLKGESFDENYKASGTA